MISDTRCIECKLETIVSLYVYTDNYIQTIIYNLLLYKYVNRTQVQGSKLVHSQCNTNTELSNCLTLVKQLSNAYLSCTNHSLAVLKNKMKVKLCECRLS